MQREALALVTEEVVARRNFLMRPPTMKTKLYARVQQSVVLTKFVARGVDAILNETQRAGRRSKGLEVQKNIRGSQLTARASGRG